MVLTPLLAGGGLFETGAGGSAPKHVRQFIKEGHLRWDSLGEFLALAESLTHYARYHNNAKAKVLADSLSQATTLFLENKQSPGRKAGELSNSGSHALLAMYWAQQLAAQNDDLQLKEKFSAIAKALAAKIHTISKELQPTIKGQIDIGGYYHPDEKKIATITRSSATLNAILDDI